MKQIKLLFTFLILIALASMAYAVTPLSACPFTAITSNTQYILTQDLEAIDENSCFFIAHSNVTIDGDGYSINNASAGAHGITIGAGKNITIKNLGITIGTNSNEFAIYDLGSEYLTLDNLELDGNYYHIKSFDSNYTVINNSNFQNNKLRGIWIEDSESVIIDNLTMNNESGDPIVFLTSDNPVIKNSYMQDSYSATDAVIYIDGTNAHIHDNILDNMALLQGIFVASAPDSLIENNVIMGNKSALSIGIEVGDGSNNVLIKNCNISKYETGIRTTAAGSYDNLTVQDSIFDNISSTAINYDNPENGSILRNNITNIGSIGIRLHSTVNVIARDNIINASGSPQSGITVDLRYNLVDSNTIYLDNDAVVGLRLVNNNAAFILENNFTNNHIIGNGSGIGVNVEADGQGNRFESNTLTGMWRGFNGIANETTIIYNTISDCANTAIFFNGVNPFNIVENNQITSCPDGIRVYGSDNNIVRHNTITSSTSDCVEIDSGSIGNEFTNNTLTDCGSPYDIESSEGTIIDCGGTSLIGTGGVSVGILSTTNNNLIVRNCNINNYKYGIQLTGSYLTNENANNTIINNTLNGSFINIRLSGAYNINVSNNNIGECNNSGTKVYNSAQISHLGSTADFGYIGHNTLDGKSNCEFGVNVDYNSDSAIIEYNNISNVGRGIYLSESEDGIIQNNIITNATYNGDFYMVGIMLYSSPNVVHPSDNNTIRNNTIIDAGSIGIQLQGDVTDTYIYNNSIDLVSWVDKRAGVYGQYRFTTDNIQDAGDTACGIAIGAVFKGFLTDSSEDNSDMYDRIHNYTGAGYDIQDNTFSSDVDCLLWLQGNQTTQDSLTDDITDYWESKVRIQPEFQDEWTFKVSNSVDGLQRYCPNCIGENNVTDNLYFGYHTNSKYSNRRFNYTINRSGTTDQSVVSWANTNITTNFNWTQFCSEDSQKYLVESGKGRTADCGSCTGSDCKLIGNARTYLDDTRFYNVTGDFPNGIILGADDITLDCNGMSIVGNNTAGEYGIYVLNDDNVTIKNCNVYEFKRNIYLIGSNNSKIFNNYIYNGTEQGIRLIRTNNSLIYNNTFEYQLNETIYCLDLSTDSQLNNIYNNTFKNCSYSLYVEFSSDYNTIYNNSFYDSRDKHIWIHNSNYNTIYDNYIGKNDYGAMGIRTQGGNFTNITGNTIEYSGWNGLDIDSFYNDISFNTVNYPTHHNLDLAFSIGITNGYNNIYNNTFNNSGDEAIYIQNGIYNNISNNIIRNSGDDCITIEGNSSGNGNNRLINNDILNCTDFCMYIANPQNFLINNTWDECNTAYDGDIAISSYHANHNEIMNSTFEGTNNFKFFVWSWDNASPIIQCPNDIQQYSMKSEDVPRWQFDCGSCIGSDCNLFGDGEVITTDTTSYTMTGHLPKGIIGNSDDIYLDGNGATFIGNGTDGLEGIYISSDDRNIVRGFNFVGYDRGIFLSNTINVTLTNNSIVNSTEIGIRITGSSFTLINDSDIINNTRGIDIVTSDDVNISNNDINENNFGAYIESNSNRTSIFSNTFTDNELYGIYHDDSWSANIFSNVVSYIPLSTTTSGIRIIGIGGTHNIHDNSVTGYNTGIRIGTLNAHSAIVDNNVTNTGHWTVATESNYTDISRNRITLSGWNLVYLGSYFNNVTHNFLDSWQHHGIDMHNDERYALSGNNLIAHNYITKTNISFTGDNALYITATDGNLVLNNTIENVYNTSLGGDEGYGITVEGNTSGGNMVVNNTFINVSGYCIRDGAINTTYQGNNFTDCERDTVFRTLSATPGMIESATFIDNFYSDGVALFRQVSSDTNLTINETSSSKHILNLSNDGLVTFNYSGRKTITVNSLTINSSDMTTPNNDLKNVSNGTNVFINLAKFGFNVASNEEYAVGSYLISSFNLTKGWNLIPQKNAVNTNFSSLNVDNLGMYSYWNSTSQQYLSYVNGSTFNADFKIPSGDSYLAYATDNFTLSLVDEVATQEYLLRVRWNLQFEKEEAGETIGTINSSIGTNATIISYWNNTDKMYTSAITKFNINHNVVIPYMESYWLFMNNETTWVR